MVGSDRGTIAVVGATGLQGSAVVRALRREGWGVRALTRDPDQQRARALAEPGVEVVKVDSGHPETLTPAFEGAYGVYNVQNHHISGIDGELAQGRNVADVAHRSGVQHLVYGAAGLGHGDTGVGSWDVKVRIVSHMRELGLPLTVLRPMALMELMTAKKFYPAVSTWHMMPKLMGASRPVGWLAVDDLGVIAARAFGDPERFIGQDIALTSDVLSIDGCRAAWREVMGRPPRRFPMPVWLFEQFVGTDETTMWRWLRSHEIDLKPEPTRSIHPDALTVESWLRRKAASASGRRPAPRPEPGAGSA